MSVHGHCSAECYVAVKSFFEPNSPLNLVVYILSKHKICFFQRISVNHCQYFSMLGRSSVKRQRGLELAIALFL